MRRVPATHFLLAAYTTGVCVALAWQVPFWTLAAIGGAAVLLILAATEAPVRDRLGVTKRHVGAGECQGVRCEPTRRQRHATSAGTLLGLVLLFAVAGHTVAEWRLASIAHSVLKPLIGRTVTVRAVIGGLPKLQGTRLQVPVRVIQVNGRPVREGAQLELKVPQSSTSAAAWPGQTGASGFRLPTSAGAAISSDRAGNGQDVVSASAAAASVLSQAGLPPLDEGALVTLAAVRVEALPETLPGEFNYARYLERRGEHVVLAAPLSDVRCVGRRGGLSGLIDRLRRSARTRLNAGLSPPVGPVLQGMVLGDADAVDSGSLTDFRRSGLLHILAVSGENVVLLCTIWSSGLLLVGVPRTLRTLICLPVIVVYVVLTGASPSIVRAGIAGCVGLLAGLSSRPSDGWLLWLLPAAAMLSVSPYALFDVSFQLSFAAVLGLLVLAGRLTTRLSFLPGPLAEQVGVTTAATMATAPISLATFGQTSLVAIPANVAGGFALGPIMFLGMMSVLGGLIVPLLSVPLNLVNGVCIGFLLTVAHLFGNLSFAVYEWHGPTLAFALALGAAGEALVLQRLARRAQRPMLGYVCDRERRPRIVGATAAVLVAILIATPPPPSPPAFTTLRFLDVGEGAATLIQVPHGPTVLIDGGPQPLADELRARGVRAVDLLVLSHPHADHIDGLASVVASLPVRVALLPRPLEPSAALENLRASLLAAGTVVRTCTVPLTLRLGTLAVHVLPTASLATERNQSENDHALVVVADLGPAREPGATSVLIPGDAEAPALRRLNLAHIAVVELPHHGSNDGLDESLLHEMSPRIAVISVGAHNRYGHPVVAMLRLLAAAGVPCLRTDQVGEVDLTLTASGLAVHTARPPPPTSASPR